MKTALVCGAGGFIGHHMVRRLKQQGYLVRGVDQKYPEFSVSAADEFDIMDLRESENCRKVLRPMSSQYKGWDEVYQFAADMGGMGFIQFSECEIMHNNVLINVNMVDQVAKSHAVRRYFFSSSACVYADQAVGAPFVGEESAYPAMPDNEYGWEKLYSERMALTYGRRFGFEVRIARFQNCYGREGTWEGGREKAPAALCRKVAEVADGGTIEVWGDGTAVRSFTHISDMLEGIYLLMQSTVREPVNIGSSEFVTVNDLVSSIKKVSGKEFQVKHVDGPVGVAARYHTFKLIEELGWKSRVSLEQGIEDLYPWICDQLKRTA